MTHNHWYLFVAGILVALFALIMLGRPEWITNMVAWLVGHHQGVSFTLFAIAGSLGILYPVATIRQPRNMAISIVALALGITLLFFHERFPLTSGMSDGARFTIASIFGIVLAIFQYLYWNKPKK